jgi:hypothetical protein
MTPDTLGDALPREIARVRDVLLPAYQGIGPAGAFGVVMLRQALDRANVAMIEGDLVKMIAAYEELKM